MNKKRILRNVKAKFHDSIFKRVHRGQLIYNTCWEDPAVDRELLGINEESRIIVISSAGCNALEYLLDDPAEVHGVDMNYRQNALLELKKAFYTGSDYESLFAFFGMGSSPTYKETYASIRHLLPFVHQEYWDDNIKYFKPGKLRRSFYYHGGAGTSAWVFRYLFLNSRPKIRRKLRELLTCQDLEEQKIIYDQLEPMIWNKLSHRFVSNAFIMSLLGVPRAQIKLIQKDFTGGLAVFIKDRIRHVMTNLQLNQNYFWSVYLTGSYNKNCCPAYLKEENFDIIASRIHRLETHTTTLSDLLKTEERTFNRFVLLDHQDWMAHHRPDLLTIANKVLVLDGGRQTGFGTAEEIAQQSIQQAEKNKVLNKAQTDQNKKI
ncbi:MAG: DUF3419 family protein, partial [Planctomycetes bacterium]|nr:DUF3419 family protein [Planctomycetota bacterium]